MKNLHKLFIHEISGLYDFEKKLLAVMPNIINKANSPILRETFHTHLEETKNQLKQIEHICEILNISCNTSQCQPIQHIINSLYISTEEGVPSYVEDASILSCYQKVKHLEIGMYKIVLSYSKTVGEISITKLLESTLQDEFINNEKLEEVADKYVYSRAKS